MSEWTLDTLKEYVEARFAAKGEATEIAMEAAQKAVDKAERLADLRAESQDRMAREHADRQNEWRQTINDVIGERLTRMEYETAHSMLVEKIDALSERLTNLESRGIGASRAFTWLFITIGAVVGVCGLVFGLIELFTQ